MAIRKIARMGHEVLRLVSEPIADPTAPEIAALAQDLIDTCEDISGNGIAAPQVYEPVRMFVFRVRKGFGEPMRGGGLIHLVCAGAGGARACAGVSGGTGHDQHGGWNHL